MSAAIASTLDYSIRLGNDTSVNAIERKLGSMAWRRGLTMERNADGDMLAWRKNGKEWEELLTATAINPLTGQRWSILVSQEPTLAEVRKAFEDRKPYDGEEYAK